MGRPRGTLPEPGRLLDRREHRHPCGHAGDHGPNVVPDSCDGDVFFEACDEPAYCDEGSAWFLFEGTTYTEYTCFSPAESGWTVADTTPDPSRRARPPGTVRAVDAPQVQLPPEPPASQAPLRLAAVDLGPVNPEQAALCRDAGSFDWAYLGALVFADAGAIVLDAEAFQSDGHASVRLVGPGLVGLTWGWSVGGAWLTLPQCSPVYVNTRLPEGDTRSVTPLAVSLGVLAAATAPLIVGVETGEGSSTLLWSPGERVMRLVISSATGAVGSAMPYLLPPHTWRAYRKLQRLQAGADAHGGMVSYAFTF